MKDNNLICARLCIVKCKIIYFETGITPTNKIKQKDKSGLMWKGGPTRITDGRSNIVSSLEKPHNKPRSNEPRRSSHTHSGGFSVLSLHASKL